jgi:hypothetical protein
VNSGTALAKKRKSRRRCTEGFDLHDSSPPLVLNVQSYAGTFTHVNAADAIADGALTTVQS